MPYPQLKASSWWWLSIRRLGVCQSVSPSAVQRSQRILDLLSPACWAPHPHGTLLHLTGSCDVDTPVDSTALQNSNTHTHTWHNMMQFGFCSSRLFDYHHGLSQDPQVMPQKPVKIRKAQSLYRLDTLSNARPTVQSIEGTQPRNVTSSI